MSRSNSKALTSAAPVLVAALVAFIIYLPVLFYADPVNPDAQIVLPLLREIRSINQYVVNLFMLRTMDVQPVRDLSLFIDLWIAGTTGFNSAILQNLIIWIFGLVVLNRLLVIFFPSLDWKQRTLILVGFAAYPLFTQTVSWGIARKHLLAFLFSLLATERWIKHRRSAVVFYMLAVLSQPIFILWPLWALGHGVFVDRELLRNRWLTLMFCFALLYVLGAANYFYYDHSPVFLTNYDPKTDELFEVANKSLALGHYTFQLFFPYLLSFDYSLGHWSTLAGLGLLGVGLLFLMRRRESRRLKLSFLIYTFLPLGVVLTKPTMVYDTYLLLPAVGVLLLTILAIQEVAPVKHSQSAFLIVILFWTAFSHREVYGWRSEVALTKNGFARRPTCITAFQFLRMSYENGEPPSDPSAKYYLLQNDCLKEAAIAANLVKLQANMLYYEQDLAPSARIDRLEELAPKAVYASMALVALYLKFERKEEANAAIGSMLEKYSAQTYKVEVITIVDEVIAPYCREIRHDACTKFLAPFVKKK